jgi:hypothetical protein
MAWRLLRLWMQKASIYSVAINILNKELWVANKQWSSGLVVRRAANTPYHKNIKHYEMERTDRPGTLEWLFKNCDDMGLDKGS